MARQKRDYLWIGVFAILVTFAIPWFLWGNTTTWFGLPIWLWWHIGWMALATFAFTLFARGAWDRAMNVDPGEVGFDG
jgi:hypothetical protein